MHRTPFTNQVKGRREYDSDRTRELQGHPLPCAQVNSDCLSTLRLLRAVAPHYKNVRNLLSLVYNAIRLHKVVHSIDVALCTGKFETLCRLLNITDYAELLSASYQSADHYRSGEAQLSVLQEPSLPDLETYLHVQHAELILNFEKSLEDDPEFPCCSCELLLLLLRKQVTALNFTDKKFSSDLWKTLKTHISKRNSKAAKETHYVCNYSRVRLNKNEMPCRCVLNGLVVEPVPTELKALDPLSKQMIQRSKAFRQCTDWGPTQGRSLVKTRKPVREPCSFCHFHCTRQWTQWKRYREQLEVSRFCCQTHSSTSLSTAKLRAKRQSGRAW